MHNRAATSQLLNRTSRESGAIWLFKVKYGTSMNGVTYITHSESRGGSSLVCLQCSNGVSPKRCTAFVYWRLCILSWIKQWLRSLLFCNCAYHAELALFKRRCSLYLTSRCTHSAICSSKDMQTLRKLQETCGSS